MFQILRSVPFHDIWVGIFLFLKKKKKTGQFPPRERAQEAWNQA